MDQTTTPNDWLSLGTFSFAAGGDQWVSLADNTGEPYTDVNGSGSSISIGLIIEGQAGEVYEPGAAKNGRRMPAPKFTVFDESSTVLGSGSFEYG